jgi:CUB/sushi domain-containing protein
MQRREYKSKGKLICNTGYKLTGDSEATCIIRCENPTFNNGRIEATRREYKSKGKLICNTGYKLTGDSEATCQDDGTWKSSGHCEIISCELTISNNGRNEVIRKEYKSKAYLVCSTGFKLAGDSEVTCEDDGTWKGSGRCEVSPWVWNVLKALAVAFIGVAVLFFWKSEK